MKFLLMALVVMTILSASGCAGDKCKELFETAQFEEKQHNQEHAIKLYEEILAKYPDCAVARQARERIAALKAKP